MPHLHGGVPQPPPYQSGGLRQQGVPQSRPCASPPGGRTWPGRSIRRRAGHRPPGGVPSGAHLLPRQQQEPRGDPDGRGVRRGYHSGGQPGRAVTPGASGRSFQYDVIEKIKNFVKNNQHFLNSEKDFQIGVDGGISKETANIAVKAGAEVLISGSSIFWHEHKSISECISEISESISDF